jgi:ubiquinone/menaquinone biosynthesis C-methylase UbiE
MAPPLRGRRVLDVGCGTGASLETLLEAVGPQGRAVGLDASLGMLREARRRLPRGSPLVLLDGCAFGRAFRRPFDAVVYNAVLFMLPDARASLASAVQVLAPGGVVLVANLEGAFLSPEGKPVPEVLADRGYTPGRHALSPWATVVAALEESLGSPEVRRLTVPMEPAGFRAFYGMEPMSAGLLPSLPYPERRAAVESLSREWDECGQRVEQVWNLASATKKRY